MKITNYIDQIDRDALRAQADQMLNYANEARVQAKKWGNYAVDRARGFAWLDFIVLKLCMMSLGLWIGSKLSGWFKKLHFVLFATFLASWAYLFWRVFLKNDD